MICSNLIYLSSSILYDLDSNTNSHKSYILFLIPYSNNTSNIYSLPMNILSDKYCLFLTLSNENTNLIYLFINCSFIKYIIKIIICIFI